MIWAVIFASFSYWVTSKAGVETEQKSILSIVRYFSNHVITPSIYKATVCTITYLYYTSMICIITLLRFPLLLWYSTTGTSAYSFIYMFNNFSIRLIILDFPIFNLCLFSFIFMGLFSIYFAPQPKPRVSAWLTFSQRWYVISQNTKNFDENILSVLSSYHQRTSKSYLLQSSMSLSVFNHNHQRQFKP